MDDNFETVHDQYNSYVNSSQDKIPLPKPDPRMPSPEAVDQALKAGLPRGVPRYPGERIQFDK